MLVITNVRGVYVMEGGSQPSTRDKIMLAAIDLMAEKGYAGVSTKEIAAAAGFSEMTLFRHFGSKQNLLETTVDRFYYTAEMKKLFSEKLVWDLQTDLLLVSRTYHESMNRNRKTLMIIMKEAHNLPGFRERVHKHPQQLKEMLTQYFETMQKKGKMIETNAEAQALSFMLMNYGAFISHLQSGHLFANVGLEEWIETSVRSFAKAVTP